MKQVRSIPFTKEGMDRVKAEFDQLTRDRVGAVANLRQAREMGDLSENGYYKAARARLSFMDGRLRHLTKLIRLGKIQANFTTDFVTMGSCVTVSDGKSEREFKIVGEYEADPVKGRITHVSPIGRALLGKRAGDTAEVIIPAGRIRYQIKKIS